MERNTLETTMGLMFDALARAVLYSLHPKVWLGALLPFLLMGAGALGLAYWGWDWALGAVRSWLQASALVDVLAGWLTYLGVVGFKAALAPLLVIALATPFVVVGSLLAVAWLLAPSLTAWVGQRRFAQLHQAHGGGFFSSLLWSLWSLVLALLALVLSLPLWLIPPLVLVVPPLIWGWLTFRVMAFDALAQHASAEERRNVMAQHRLPLLAIGVISGYLGAAPGLIWASGAVMATAFVVMVPLAVWLYTWLFAFSALWFAHYALAALAQMRALSAQTSSSAAQDSAAADLAGAPNPALPTPESKHESQPKALPQP